MVMLDCISSAHTKLKLLYKESINN